MSLEFSLKGPLLRGLECLLLVMEILSFPLFAGEEPAATYTANDINRNISTALSRKSDLIQQSVDDNSIQFGDLSHVVQSFEQGFLQVGLAQAEIMNKRKSFSIAVQTAVIDAAIKTLNERLSRDFLSSNGIFQVIQANWIERDRLAARAVLYVKARYPTFDLSKALLLVTNTQLHTLDSVIYHFSREKEFLSVEVPLSFGGYQVVQKVRVPVLGLPGVEKIYLQQIYGTAQVLLMPVSIYGGSGENLERDLTFLYGLIQLKIRSLGIDDPANYPLADDEAKMNARKRLEEVVKKQDWAQRAQEMKKTGLFLVKHIWRDDSLLQEKLDFVFSKLVESQYARLMTNEAIQSHTDMIRFLRGLRKKEEILTSLKKLKRAHKSPIEPGGWVSPFIPALYEEVYAVLAES